MEEAARALSKVFGERLGLQGEDAELAARVALAFGSLFAAVFAEARKGGLGVAEALTFLLTLLGPPLRELVVEAMLRVLLGE